MEPKRKYINNRACQRILGFFKASSASKERNSLGPPSSALHLKARTVFTHKCSHTHSIPGIYCHGNKPLFGHPHLWRRIGSNLPQPFLASLSDVSPPFFLFLNPCKHSIHSNLLEKSLVSIQYQTISFRYLLQFLCIIAPFLKYKNKKLNIYVHQKTFFD